MPRRFNYTDRERIGQERVRIRLLRNDSGLSFQAEVNLGDLRCTQRRPVPEIWIEAYRGASALSRRFFFGHADSPCAPEDCGLNEFGVPEGILFRLKAVESEEDKRGLLVGEADRIRPILPDQQEASFQPLLNHMPAEDLGHEPWRLDFSDDLPLLKVNSRLPIGVNQFLTDPQLRAVFAPAVARQVLFRILVVERYSTEQDEEDGAATWQQRWLRFGVQMNGGEPVPEVDSHGPHLQNLDSIEQWIDSAVEKFAFRSKFLEHLSTSEQRNQS